MVVVKESQLWVPKLVEKLEISKVDEMDIDLVDEMAYDWAFGMAGRTD